MACLQVINNKSDQPLASWRSKGVAQLCKTLATAIRQRMHARRGLRRKVTKYDGLVADGVIDGGRAGAVPAPTRATEAKTVEHMLMASYQVRPAQIGPSLAKFFGVPYEPLQRRAHSFRSLHGPLKREFIEEQGWIPLEESTEGLVIMCLDPEAVRGSRIVPQVFPRISKFAYRVTTQTEFQETLASCTAPEPRAAAIDEMLADMDSGPSTTAATTTRWSRPLPTTNWSSSSTRSSSTPTTRASDIHIEPMPGKFKTGIRFRIDGTLQPYIEVPAHFARPWSRA
jgi:hypothetical protein